jgi:hypothetical protein
VKNYAINIPQSIACALLDNEDNQLFSMWQSAYQSGEEPHCPFISLLMMVGDGVVEFQKRSINQVPVVMVPMEAGEDLKPINSLYIICKGFTSPLFDNYQETRNLIKSIAVLSTQYSKRIETLSSYIETNEKLVESFQRNVQDEVLKRRYAKAQMSFVSAIENLKAYTKSVISRQDMAGYTTSSSHFPVLSREADSTEDVNNDVEEGEGDAEEDDEEDWQCATGSDSAAANRSTSKVGGKRLETAQKSTSNVKRQKTGHPEKLFSSRDTEHGGYVKLKLHSSLRTFYSVGLASNAKNTT